MSDYFDTGFCVRQASWHGKETLLQEHPENWADARRLAGLEWEPAYAPIYVERLIPAEQEVPAGAVLIGRADLSDGTFARRYHVPQGDHKAIVRDDTWATLAVPSESYELIYHRQMGELLEAYLESWQKAGARVRYETAGSVEGGKRVWALVVLDEPWHAPGDPSATYPYAAITNAHDGSAACRVTPLNVRIVCANTWRMADLEAGAHGHGVVIRHTASAADRIEEAKATLAGMRDEAKQWQMTAEELARINVTDAMYRTFLDEFIPVPEGASDRTRGQRDERRKVFTALYEGTTAASALTMEGITGNGYGLVQAAGEYLDHLRPYRTPDTYLARTLLRPESIKGGVVKLVRELATA